MIRLRKEKRGKVFKAWLIYYTIILLLPILLAALVYNKALDVITTENKNVREASLQQIGIQIDAELQVLRTTGTNILLNDKISNLGKIEGNLGAQEYYDLFLASKDLNKYLLINSFIQKIYIYFNRSGCMLSDSGTIESDQVAAVAQSLGFDEPTWQNYMQNKQDNNYLVIDTAQGEKMVYMQSISVNNKSRAPLFTILIVTNTPQITGLLEDMKVPNEGTLILLGENDRSLSTNPVLASGIHKNLADDQSGSGNKDGFVVIKLDSSVSRCKYILALPYAYYQQKAEYINTIVALYLAVCLTLGFILIYYFSRHNYVPLQKLKNALETEDAAGSSASMNEFSVFEQKIKSLVSKKEQLQKKLTDNNEITRNNILYCMLKGKPSGIYQKTGDFSDCGLLFRSSCFIVFLLEVESSGEKLFAEKDEETVLPIITILLKDIFETVTGGNYAAYFVECDGQIAGVVNYSQDIEKSAYEAAQYEMEQVIGTVIYYVKERCDVSLTAALGTPHEGYRGIREAYCEAFDAFDYKHLKGETMPVIRYSKGGLPKLMDLKGGSAILDAERQFYELIVNGDYKGAYGLLQSFTDYCCAIDIHSLHVAKFRIFSFVNILLDVLSEIKTESNAKFIENLNPIDHLIGASTLTELQKETFYVMDCIIQCFEKQASGISDKMAAVTSYINREYFRGDLCVQMLAEKFGMSVSYLSRMYKKTTGEGLLDYIHRVRLQKAKPLLAGGMSIKAVADKVGYYSSHGLIRSFKRYEGITPGQYKAD